MTQKDLIRKMYHLSGLYDFLIILSNEYNPVDWGEYYPKNKVIVIFTRDEHGRTIDEDSIIRICCHELAHHMQYHHLENYKVESGEEHDQVFKELFANLLNKYYNGEVPIETIEVLKEEGLLYEPSSKKKDGARESKTSRGNIHKHLSTNS